MLKALIFDVDGTLADTELAHLAAFNHAFAQAGLGWHWSNAEYKGLLKITGGKERILHYWQSKDPQAAAAANAQDTVTQLHRLKTAHYTQAVRGGSLHLLAGVEAMIQAAQARGLHLAIATTTTPANIDALLSANLGPDWRAIFPVVEDGSTAPNKKPNPQVYLQALARLGLQADECIALEDSENGLRAANSAGIATVVTPNPFTQGQNFANAWQVLLSLENAEQLLSQWVHSKANGSGSGNGFA